MQKMWLKQKLPLKAHKPLHNKLFGLGSKLVILIHSAPVKFLIDGLENCAEHSRSYGQAV